MSSASLRLFRICLNALAIASLAGLPAVALTGTRLGDAKSVFDARKFDERYPQMKVWASAGVEGGIPERADNPPTVSVEAGGDIQAAIDSIEKGVVLLKAGKYPVARTINLKSNVILRGEGPTKTLLEASCGGKYVFVMENLQRAAIEDLTATTVIKGGQGGSLLVNRSKNCWVQNCSFVNSTDRPARIASSEHITVRDSVFDTAQNRGSGAGYFELVDKPTSFCLLYNNTFKHLRHVCIHFDAHDNVMFGCHFVDTDLNWHDKYPMNNLVEFCDFDNKGHTWGVMAEGWARQHTPPGEGNLLYKLDGIGKSGDPIIGDEKTYRQPFNPDGTLIYTMRSQWNYPMMVPTNLAPPAAETFYAVTGEHILLPGQEAPLAKTLQAGMPLLSKRTFGLKPLPGNKAASLADLLEDLPADLISKPGVDLTPQQLADVAAWVREKNKAVQGTQIALTGTVKKTGPEHLTPTQSYISIAVADLAIRGQNTSIIATLISPESVKALEAAGITKDGKIAERKGKITNFVYCPPSQLTGNAVLLIDAQE